MPYYAEQQKRAIQTRYEEAWLNGRYVLMAVAHALGGTKNPYPEKPEDLYKDDYITEQETASNALEAFKAAIIADNKKRYGIASLDAEKLKEAEQKKRGD